MKKRTIGHKLLQQPPTVQHVYIHIIHETIIHSVCCLFLELWRFYVHSLVLVSWCVAHTHTRSLRWNKHLLDSTEDLNSRKCPPVYSQLCGHRHRNHHWSRWGIPCAFSLQVTGPNAHAHAHAHAPAPAILPAVCPVLPVCLCLQRRSSSSSYPCCTSLLVERDQTHNVVLRCRWNKIKHSAGSGPGAWWCPESTTWTPSVITVVCTVTL